MAEEKTVDLDTSGPGAEIVLEDKEVSENTNENKEVTVETSETNNEDSNKSVDASSESDQQSDVEKTEEVKAEDKTDDKTETIDDSQYNPSESDLKKYSAQVRRRIGKEVAKRKEAERQRDEVSQYTKMILEERDKLKTRLTKLDTNYVTEVESRIKSGVQAAEAKLASARESGDIKSEIEAQKEIARLGYEEARLADLKISQTKEKPVAQTAQQPQPQQYTQPQQRPEIDEKTQEWIEKNKSWFGKVRGMTATAYDIHDSLLNEGYDATDDEYFEELDRRLRVEFPSKFDTVEKPTAEKVARPAQTVASAKRPAATGRKNTVQLTPTEVAIANKLGVSLEDYAKEKYAKGV